jgi:hypothetical protein
MSVTIGETNYSRGAHTLTIINPDDRTFYGKAYVLWFGACGPTRLLAYAKSLEDALETCVDWIVDNAPGLLADEQVHEAYNEAIDAAREVGEDVEDDDVQCRCQDEATVDTTICGDHYLHSSEWGIVVEQPSRANMLELIGRDDEAAVRRACERMPVDALQRRCARSFASPFPGYMKRDFRRGIAAL